MTLLTTVQNAMALCSLSVPGTVYANNTDIVKQMVRLLYVEGRDLVKRHDWSILMTPNTFTCGASNAQTNHPPSDFDRFSRGAQIFNVDNKQPLIGPLNADEWVEALVQDISAYPQYWRLIANVLNIEPPVSGVHMRYEYISNKWIKQAGTTLSTSLAGDTDTFVFPENVLELGLVWRFKQAKGLDYGEDMRTYGVALADAIASDRGGRRIVNTSRPERVYQDRTWHGTVDY